MATDFPKLVSLEQFRRAKTAKPEGLASADSSSAEQQLSPSKGSSAELPCLDVDPRTARRIAAAFAAIDTLKRLELVAIVATDDPKNYRVRFSAALVAREARIGRTQMYTGSGTILSAVEAARAELLAALDDRRSARRTTSRRSLEQKIAELKGRHETELRRIASTTMGELIARMGPHIEGAQRAGNQLANLQARIRQLEDQLSNQVATNKLLVEALNRARKGK